MVGGRSGLIRNVPTDFLRSLRTEIGRYLAGIGDAKVSENGLMRHILLQISRCIENEKKCARKPKNESCQEGPGEGQDKSATPPRTSYEASGSKSGDIWSASVMPKSTKLGQCAAFLFKSRDALILIKNVSENPKLKVVRKDRGKVRTSPQHPQRLAKASQNTFRAI